MLKTALVNFCVCQHSSKMLMGVSLVPSDLDKIRAGCPKVISVFIF